MRVSSPHEAEITDHRAPVSYSGVMSVTDAHPVGERPSTFIDVEIRITKFKKFEQEPRIAKIRGITQRAIFSLSSIHACTRGSHNESENIYTNTNYARKFFVAIDFAVYRNKEKLGAVTHRQMVSR